MKKYIKNKPIKWGFKFWYHGASETGYLYQLDFWVKKKAQKNQVLFWKWLSSFKIVTVCFFFYNFFNSPSLTVKIYEGGLCGTDTARKERKGMPKMCLLTERWKGVTSSTCSNKVISCKCLDRRSVTMLFSNVEGIATTSTVPCWQKGSASKIKYLAQTLSKCTIKEWVVLT